MDEPTVVGCLVEARLIGVIEAGQIKDDNPARRQTALKKTPSAAV